MVELVTDECSYYIEIPSLWKNSVKLDIYLIINHESLSVKVIENQDSVIRLQQEVISSVKDAVKTSVTEDSVKVEFETYSSVLQSNSNPDFSPIHVREVVRTAVDEQDRSRNLIVFGLTEEVNENLESAVGEVMQQLGEKPRAAVTRLGKVANIGESRNSRPVKVTFTSSLMVSTILSKSKDLKGTTKFSNVFICPDRSSEQRVAHRKLVSELRNKQKEEADKRHFIRGDKVYSVDIGQTISEVRTRMNGHRSAFKTDKDGNRPHHGKSALAQHCFDQHRSQMSMDIFRIGFVRICKLSDLDREECRYINKYRTEIIGLNRIKVIR